MSVPMIGPGPLEGGPKGSPGPAKNADEFSACLKEECGREAPPAGDPLPPQQSVSGKSVMSADPEPSLQPAFTSGSEQSVDTAPVVGAPVSVPINVGLAPSVPNPLLVKEIPDLMVLMPDAVDPSWTGDVESLPVGGGLIPIAVEGAAKEEESDTDVPSVLKESAVSAPLAPVLAPVPLVVAEVPLAVVVPEADRSVSTEGLKGEPAENPGVVEAVSINGRESNTGFVAPVVENQKAGRGSLPSLEPDRASTPPPSVQTPDPSLPKGENDRPDRAPATLDSSGLIRTTPSMGDRFSENREMPASQKLEIPIPQKSGPLTSVQSTMPAPESKSSSIEQDATFREALKAVSDAGSSFKGSAGVVLTGEGVVSTSGINKGVPVETVRPAVPVPVLSPSPVELAKQIHVHLESGRSVVHVELHPEHLGEMNIALEAKGKDVSMRFTVDNDTARHSVVAGLKELSGSLNTLGWTVNGLAVQVASGGVGNGRSDADGSRWAAFPVNVNQVPLEQKTESRPSPSGAWRVDLVA